MKRSLNTLHYSIYVIETKLHFLFNKINPALLLYKIPRVKKRMKDKYGIENTKEWLDHFWLDKKDGYSLSFVGGFFVGVIFLCLMSSVILLEKLLNLNISFKNYHYLFLGAISYTVCYFFVFKKNTYLAYFNEFEKWTTFKKRKNVLLSIGFILLIIVFFFVSLLYSPY